MRFHKDFDSVFAALLKAKITIADFFFGSLQLSAMLSPSKCSRNCNIFVLWLLLLRLQHIFWKKVICGTSLLCFVQFPSSNNPSPINIWIMIIMCWNLLVLYLCICQVTLIHFLDKSCKKAQWKYTIYEGAFLFLSICYF